MSECGAKLIAKERRRQIEEEGWTAEHDAEHGPGDLALAAVCYASPVKIYTRSQYARGFQMEDPFPWECKWDKRFDYGERRENPGNVLPDPDTYTSAERIDLLVKAGALIAAEIDRLQAVNK